MMESCNLSPIVFLFCFAKVGDDPQEDLAKFDYNLNIKVKIKKHPSIIFGYIFWTMYRNMTTFLYNLIMGNLKKHFILALSNFQ